MANKEKTAQPYEVLARKYRPQSFDDVVGQDHLIQTLKNAIAIERVAHAYLFVGPRGTGKTSTARILAKALNCEQGPKENPCNNCDMCKEITIGSSMDVIEIDGASNNGVEQVREINENVRFMPSRARFKIYIIDEVHMLTTAAFNALLKTLEEPPEHVKFFFATTEGHKVPATILSRCQRFDLRRIPTNQIVERLQQITKAEKIEADENALIAVARGADGGMRDAQSALDQLISFQGKNIAEEDVLSVFGLVSHEAVSKIVSATLTGDVATLIEAVQKYDAEGKDLQRLVVDLIDHFRNILIYLHTQKTNLLLELTESQREGIVEQAGFTDAGKVSRIAEILLQTEGKLRMALSRRTTLEMALIRCARSAMHASVDQILDELNKLKQGLPLDEESGKKKP